MLSEAENLAGIARRTLAWLTGAADEAVAVSHGTSGSRRARSDRILVDLPLPGDALIEFVVGRWLGLWVEL